MEALRHYNRLFGLIGYPLSHSFSKKYFSEKFEREDIRDTCYELFPIPEINELPGLLKQYPNLTGLNVTIPYKQAVLPFLDELSAGASAVGAVNTILINSGRLIGYNTDVAGFETSLRNWLLEERRTVAGLRALILGTGGAAKAVAFVLEQMHISFDSVSRSPGPGQISYAQITPDLLGRAHLIINTTPLGMAPNTQSKPDLPYGAVGEAHFFYDLVYNPAVTAFMEAALSRGARAKNGLDMLYGQAEAAWSIWTDSKEKK